MAKKPVPKASQSRIEAGSVGTPASGQAESALAAGLHASVQGQAGGAAEAAYGSSPIPSRALFTVAAEAAAPPDEVNEADAIEAGALAYGLTPAARVARMGAALTGPALEVIFADDRTRVTATTAYPYRCICHLLSRFRNADGDVLHATGTGWVVGKRTLITAGHCVYVFSSPKYKLSRVWAEEVRVVPGRDGEAWPFGSFTVPTASLWSTGGWVNEGREEADYGAIILGEDLPADHGRFGFGVLDDGELDGLRANVVGYPGEFKTPPKQGTLWGDDSPPLMAPTATQLRYRIDTTPGQSGSAVFFVRPEEGDAIAVGVHNYGLEGAHNTATRITAAVRERLREWRDKGGV